MKVCQMKINFRFSQSNPDLLPDYADHLITEISLIREIRQNEERGIAGWLILEEPD